MIINENVVEELKTLKVVEGEVDIENEIRKILKKHNVDFDEVYQNEFDGMFVRIYKGEKIIALITLDTVSEFEKDEDGDEVEITYSIIEKIDEDMEE